MQHFEKSLNYFWKCLRGLKWFGHFNRYLLTLQSNINYLKAGHLSDQLKIEGLCVHNGKTTKVVEVVITNQEEKILQGLHLLFPMMTGQLSVKKKERF